MRNCDVTIAKENIPARNRSGLLSATFLLPNNSPNQKPNHYAHVVAEWISTVTFLETRKTVSPLIILIDASSENEAAWEVTRI